MLEQSPVRRIDLEEARPVVITDSARIVADADRFSRRVGQTAACRVFPYRYVQRVSKCSIFARPMPAPFGVGRFPVFIYKGAGDDDAFYGMPEFQGLASRWRGTAGLISIPISMIATYRKSTCRPSVTSCESIFRAGGRADRLTEVCLYTVAPDEQFQVDFLPGRSDVIVASPCSGHGFKFSCLIGGVLADLASTGRTELNIAPWQIAGASS